MRSILSSAALLLMLKYVTSKLSGEKTAYSLYLQLWYSSSEQGWQWRQSWRWWQSTLFFSSSSCLRILQPPLATPYPSVLRALPKAVAAIAVGCVFLSFDRICNFNIVFFFLVQIFCEVFVSAQKAWLGFISLSAQHLNSYDNEA